MTRPMSCEEQRATDTSFTITSFILSVFFTYNRREKWGESFVWSVKVIMKVEGRLGWRLWDCKQKPGGSGGNFYGLKVLEAFF